MDLILSKEWYPGKLLVETIIPHIKRKILAYSHKFKEFDERIVEGVALCYKYSPLFRNHFDSEYFGKSLGWRITHLWTKNVYDYEALSMIGPLDLGLYSVRIDGILGNLNLSEFVRDSKNAPVFKKYIEATNQFMLSLLSQGEFSWLYYEETDIVDAINLCKKHSKTLNEVLTLGENDGWDITCLWTEKPEQIKSLRKIYPLDVAIYCVRLDSVINGTDLSDFSKEASKIPAFKLFPMEILRFTYEVRRSQHFIS